MEIWFETMSTITGDPESALVHDNGGYLLPTIIPRSLTGGRINPQRLISQLAVLIHFTAAVDQAACPSQPRRSSIVLEVFRLIPRGNNSFPFDHSPSWNLVF